jgi:hypothetical protein
MCSASGTLTPTVRTCRSRFAWKQPVPETPDSGGGRYRLVSHGRRKRNHSANSGSNQSVLGSSHRGDDEKDASDGRAVPMPGRIILMLMETNANKPRKLTAQGVRSFLPPSLVKGVL